MLGRILGSIRSRPLAERRIIGVATYLAVASVALALWVTSFRSSLSPQLAGEPAGQTEASDAAEPGVSSAESEKLRSPLATLRESLRDFTGAIRELTDSAKQLARGEIAPTASTTAGNSPPEMIASAPEKLRPAATTTPSAKTTVSVKPTKPPTPAELLENKLEAKRYSTFRLALLIEPVVDRVDQKGRGITRFFKENSAKILDSITGAYRAITE